MGTQSTSSPEKTSGMHLKGQIHIQSDYIMRQTIIFLLWNQELLTWETDSHSFRSLSPFSVARCIPTLLSWDVSPCHPNPPPLWVSDWFPTYVPLHGETHCESTVSHNFSQVAGEGRVCRGLDPTSTQYCGFFLFLVWYQNSWNIMTANYHSIWSNQHLPVFLRLQCKTELCFLATP